MDKFINFINAVSVPFVALVLVVLGAFVIITVGFIISRRKRQELEFEHQEKMTKIPLDHEEILAKWEYERAKTIQGKAIEHQKVQDGGDGY